MIADSGIYEPYDHHCAVESGVYAVLKTPVGVQSKANGINLGLEARQDFITLRLETAE